MAERCDKFTKNLNSLLQGGLKNCGLCVRRPACPDARSPLDNGRTTYPDHRMSTDFLRNETGTVQSSYTSAGHAPDAKHYESE